MASKHTIHFGKKCIITCTKDAEIPSEGQAMELDLDSVKDAASLSELMQSELTPEKVIARGDDENEIYRKICSLFKEVNAAGGLVRNSPGEALLIERNGLWDLPKGHQDPGEDISVTAVREVSEETGISALTLSDHICITDHCYFRDNIWHLKHTWWYSMTTEDSTLPVPQTEEDITKAEWVPQSRISDCLKRTYPSIAEVFLNEKA